MRKGIFWMLAPLLAWCLVGASHIGPKYSVQTYLALENFAEKLAKEDQLEFLNSGVGSLADAKQGIWAVHFVSRQQLTLDQGRELANRLAQQLLKKVFSDPLFTQYFLKQKKDPTLKKEYVAFRLAFWTKEVNRPQYPFLAQIRLADGNLYYHYVDPLTQALQEPIVEAVDLRNNQQKKTS
jgi:hypothetical protein